MTRNRNSSLSGSGGGMGLTTVVVAAALCIVATITPHAEAQAECVGSFRSLIPCYLAGSPTEKPSAECCGLIKGAAEKQFYCLCTLYNSPQLSALNTTADQILRITNDCGVPNDFSACSSKGGAGNNQGAGNDKGAADKIANTGVAGLFLVLVLMIFY